MVATTGQTNRRLVFALLLSFVHKFVRQPARFIFKDELFISFARHLTASRCGVAMYKIRLSKKLT
jgi:hypothetical protein